jgi:hypothetical protein
MKTNLKAGDRVRLLSMTDDPDPPAKLPTNDSLIDFARNCGARFVYVFDDGAWSCRAL